MTPPAIDIPAAWSAAGWTMLHLIWVGACIGALGTALRRLLRTRIPEVRYAAAVLLLILLSAAPAALFALLYDPAPAPSVSKIERVAHAAPRNIGVRAASPITNHGPATALAGTASPPFALAAAARWGPIVARLPVCWITGSAVTSLLLATGLLGTRALRRESVLVHDGEAHALARRLAESLGLDGRFGLGVCARIASPVLVGIVRPLILLPPAAFSGWTVDELEMALLHELIHLRRHDNLVNLWQCAVEALVFFHPVTWWLSAWVRLERERCCDRAVVGRTGKARPYAEMLATLAGASSSRAAVSAFAERPLVARIRTILNMEEKPMRLTLPEGFGLVGAVFVAVSAALGTCASSVPAPQIDAANRAKRSALQVLAQRAAEVAVNSPDFDDRGDALLAIAQAQFKIGDRDAAVDTIRRAERVLQSGAQQANIPPSLADFTTEVRLAEVWQVVGDAKSARAALDRASKNMTAMIEPRNSADLVKAAGLDPAQPAAAGAIAAELAAPIIELRIQLGDLDQARRLIARGVETCAEVNGPMRPSLLAHFAILAARAGDRRLARSLAVQLEQEARALPPKERADARRALVRTLAETGDFDRAFAKLKEQGAGSSERAANDILDAVRDHDPDESTIWLDPAGIKVLIGTRGTKLRGSTDRLRALAAHFRDLDDVKVQARSLSAIALLLAKAGEHNAALEVAEAVPALSRRDNPGPSDGFYDSVKPATFALVAARMTRAGDRARAAEAFGRSLSLARAIESPGERLIALIVLAEAYADTGNRAATITVVREGTEVAKSVPEPRRSRGLDMLIRARLRAGDQAGAAPMVDSLRDDPGVEKAHALVSLARAFEQAGDGVAAKFMAKRALDCTQDKKREGAKPGPAMDINGVARDTFLDPDLEFTEPFARFHLDEVASQARALLDVSDAERAARARPAVAQKGLIGGQTMALGSLVSDLASKGKLDEAMRIAGTIEDPHGKLWAYQQLARTIGGGG
jgi:beta-lactamase regulating signal transducer with metallopeptidase domain/tetratricopeptide (TPR) repeat protein